MFEDRAESFGGGWLVKASGEAVSGAKNEKNQSEPKVAAMKRIYLKCESIKELDETLDSGKEDIILKHLIFRRNIQSGTRLEVLQNLKSIYIWNIFLKFIN